MSSMAGLYLHIPFCHSKCTYCSFITGSYEDLLAERYLNALILEIKSLSSRLSDKERQIDTIYFGGGTPSIIAPSWITKLLEHCYQYFTVAPNPEITIEVNPADINLDHLQSYQKIGINRVSVGIQSFIDKQLKEIGRDHSASQASQAIKQLRKSGFDNISLDLIAGLPNQSLEQWQYNLSEAISLEPEHLSIYLLEIKAGTTLSAQIKSGRLAMPDEDLAAEMYETLVDTLTSNGYLHYEISNFAKQKNDSLLYSRHNTKYWLDVPYYGLGVSAHSYHSQERYFNVQSTNTYINNINSTGQAMAEKIALNAEERVREALMLRLRLIKGVNLLEFHKSYQFDVMANYQNSFKEMIENSLLEIKDGYLRLTPRGILYSNEVFQLFV
ncbi:MAG: radical SAM family heme chaperone HemW [Blastocatellia bacterium]